jgi:glutathione synthase/RimK-type ligase-like ATP-grasp enzyme
MCWTIAIHPDDYGRNDAASPKWAELLEQAGHRVRWVNVRHAGVLEQLRGCQGLMWRHAHFGGMHRIAHTLLPVIERELGLVVYPDQNTCWHYDDKVAQRYLLEAAGVPIPKTWVWHDARAANEWARRAEYPVVLKLAGGASSTNVRLVNSYRQAREWIDRLFGPGVYDLGEEPYRRLSWRKRVQEAVKSVAKGWPPYRSQVRTPLDGGYALFQEFLPNNSFDTRITVIGNRAFGFRRFNRPGDFRASGSGKLDWDPRAIDLRFVRLAFAVAARLRTQSCAIDGLLRGGECVVSEISYTFAQWAVGACPGHWQSRREGDSGELVWREGPMCPQQAVIEDFLARLESVYGSDPSSTERMAGMRRSCPSSQSSPANAWPDRGAEAAA